MTYFDGRESGPTDGELRRIREAFQSDAHNKRAYFIGQDVDVEPIGNGEGRVVVGDMGNRHLYPRPPTVELARELYMNGDLTEHEFEHMIGQALERDGVGWGSAGVEG